MYYVDENGKVSMKKTSTTKKKKKQQEQVHYTVDDNGKVTMNNIEDIAPVKQTTSKEKNKKWYEGYLQLGDALKDGYQFGDLTKSYTATASDLTENLTAGIVGMGEKIVDAGAYIAGGVGGLFGADDFKKKTKKFIEKDLYDEKKVAEKLVSIGINPLNTNQPLVWADKILNGKKEDNSVLGNKTDSLVQSGGQLLATTGLQMVGVPWYLTTGVTAFGEQTETAFREGATFKQAGGSALVSAGAEVLFEKLGGGIKFGGKTLDDALLRPLTEKISNKVLKATVNLGLDATGEGAEEVLTSVASRLGTSLYKEESIDELLTSEEAMDEYIDSFVGGALMGGIAGTGRTITNNTKTATLTENEKKVVDKEFENRISEAEKDGKKLSEKDKTKIYDEVLNDLDKGYISIDTIESVLGDKTYETYKTMEEQENSLKKEIESLENTPKEQFTVKQDERLKELREELAKIDKTQVKNQLSSEVSELAKVDRLSESYNEKARRSQTFEADLSKYDTKQQEVIKKATESGILNNTNRTHEFVDMVAKISADKGVLFDFTNNQKLKDSGFAVEGKTVNGYVKDGNIAVNIDSSKSLNTIVGHEITHVLEGTELYTELQEAVKNYATTKGDYDTRIKELTELYKDVKDANIEGEVTADLVGDYLFTDKDFVNNLSVEKPNIFKKIYDEIKYLYKMATAGSKEARQLEKVKRTFENAYKENISKNSDTKHSFSGSRAKTANSSLLLRAEHMLDTGVDSETVRKETGWFKGYDGRMRFEIDDSKMKVYKDGDALFRKNHPEYARLQELTDKFWDADLTPEEHAEMNLLDEVYGREFGRLVKRLENGQAKLEDILEHDVLYANYPTIAKVRVKLEDFRDGTRGYYDHNKNEIALDKRLFKSEYRTDSRDKTLIHEIQHAIQRLENFAQGSNPEFYESQKKELADWIKGARENLELYLKDIKYNEYAKDKLEEVREMRSSGKSTKEALADYRKALEEYKANSEYGTTIASLEQQLEDLGKQYETKFGKISDALTNYDLYKNTAGEIEANDTADRLRMTAEERRDNAPKSRIENVEKDSVVFAEDYKYSLSDSDGKTLTKEQQEYFKDSKVRDENGNLKVMYHGSRSGGFTVFDPKASDDNRSFFFSDKPSVASSYSDSENEIAPTGKEETKGLYKTYLNLKNPYIVDAKGNKWNNIVEHKEGDEFLSYIGQYMDIVTGMDSSIGLGDFLDSMNGDLVGSTEYAINELYIDEDTEESILTDDEQTKLREIAEQIDEVYNKWNEDEHLDEDGYGMSFEDYVRDNYNPKKTRQIAKEAQEKGYDGVIFKNLVDVGKFADMTQRNYEESTVAVAFDSNQIKTTNNLKPTEDADIRYSLSEDSDGRKLSDEQKEYFKDTKVVDEKGNLKVMYHGTSNGGHTVFDIYGSNFGLFGQGAYFTDNKSVAESYTDKGKGNNKQVYEAYLNIKNPMDMDAQANVEEWQKAFPEADFSSSKTNEDCFKAMKEYFFDNEYTKSEAYEEAWDAITNMGYDGLTHIGGGRFNKADDTRHRVYIAYEPEQIKNIDNTKPTSDADIRFSLSKPVEKTKDLVAIHNLNSDKLLSIMELGGFPMPSVAITKDTASHEGYGDITVVLKPNAIDPESNSDNKVFSADAYTPTFPATAYKLDTAELRKLAKKLDTSASMLEVNEFSSGNLSDVLNNFTKNKGAKELFVKEKGYTVEPVLRPRELNDKYLERAKEIVTSDDFSFDKLVNDLNYRENYFDKIKENSKNYGKITFVTRTVDKYINDTNEMLDIASNEKNLAEALNNQYMSDIEQLKGKGTLVEDKNSYIDGLNNLINEKSDEFNAFVKELIEPVLSSKYLRNNKNYYTESGNPRTFESLHEEYNAENAVKIMRENSDTNAVNSMLGVSLGELKAVLSKQYNSIEEMHQDKTRISEDFNEEIQAKHEECRTKFFDITKQLAETATLDNSFTAHDYAGRTILDALAKSKNAKGIYNYINKNYTGSITMELAKDIENLAKDIMELPVHYFESKPQRVVGFDEVGAVVLPYNADAKLKQQLLNNGLSIAEYNPDIEGDRKRVVNQFEDYKFSLANREQITAPYGNYNVYGKDIALEQAPVENTFINDETQTANNLLGIIANRDIKDHNVVVEDYQREQLAKKIEAIVSESNGNNKKLFELLASETRKNEDNLKAIYDIEQKWIAENKKQSDKADMPDYIHNMVSTARFYRDMLDDATQSLASKGKFDGNTLFKAILENEQVNQDYAPLTEEQANERDAEQSITSMPTEEFEKLVQSYMDDAPSFMLDEDEIRAWAEEQARQNPQGATPKENTVIPESPLEERDIYTIGRERKTNAYMYENPEVKPFFQEEAQVMLWELENSTDGKRGRKGASYGLGEEIGAFEGDWYGTKRQTSDELAYLRDNFKYDKDDLTKGLKAIIEDHGAENNAISKRIEFMLDERLREGYKDFMSNERMPANQGYINLLNEKQITEYNDEAFSNWAKTLNEDSIPTDTMQEDIAPIQQAEEMQMPTMTRPSEPNIINVPSTPSPDGKQRKWVGTSTESEPVDRKILPKDLDQNKITYQPIPNKKTLNNANSMLDRDGYDESVTYFNSQFKNKRVSLDDIALGERLIQEAVKKGDMATAGELIQNVSILGTELGQKVQALSIIQRLTPEGQLKTLNKIVERGKAKGDKAFEGVEITQEMIDHILKTYGKDGTYNQEELDKAVEDVKKDIAKQMKVTKMDKVNAWRYLSMLGNPKTHVRNIVSNVGMKGTMAVKDALARTIETVAPVKNRTKTWKPASNDVKEFAKQTTKEMQSILDDGGKYSDTNDIKSKRQIFKNKVLNAVYEFNSDMLSKEDWWFQSSAFNKAFSEYLTANGISTKEDIQNNAELIEKAKAYATEQSEIATFKQYSFIAHKLNEIESKNTATQIGVGAIVPFKKTPVNIAKTGLNYSPLGFMKTLTYDASQVKKGNMEASEMIDHLSQNITGTGLALAGYMLAMSGFLNGAGKEDKEGKYDYQLGKQAYSVNIGGNTYSLSWLTPVAMPLFVGANAFETLTEGKEWDGNVVIEALTQTLDPMSEMSVLSGLTNVLSSYESGSGIWADIAQTTGQNYVTQFVPTLSSQIATAMDDKQRSTKVAGNSDFKFLEETVNKLKLKIPVLRETLEPSTDVWGKEVKLNENKMQKAFDTFIAPYSRKESASTQIDEELKDLYADTGDGGLFPQTPKNSVNYDGEKYNMSAKEYTSFKKTYGQNALDLMEELFRTTTYQNASSSDKADMVDKVYDYASDEAKREYLAKKDIEFTNATKDGEAYYKENNIKGAIENDMPLEEFDFYNNYPEKYEFLQSNNVSYEEYSKDKETREAYNWAFKNPERYTLSKSISKDLVTYKTYTADISKFRADTDRYGKTIKDSKKKKVLNYINGLDAEYGEKLILYKSIYDADDTHNYEIIDYLNNRDDITFDEMNTILKELGFTVTADGTIYWN
jgi:hypothetical protein